MINYSIFERLEALRKDRDNAQRARLAARMAVERQWAGVSFYDHQARLLVIDPPALTLEVEAWVIAERLDDLGVASVVEKRRGLEVVQSAMGFVQSWQRIANYRASQQAFFAARDSATC